MIDSYSGPLSVHDSESEFNAHSFVISQMLGRLWTATIVQVKAVTTAGGVTPVGFVDVLPTVAQLDGQDQATAHGIIHGLPYLRAQGGANAVILDPQVGDLGVAVFASRDISSVKATKAPANPGSLRRFDPADGLYLGGVLNGAPTQYVQFIAGAINIVSPGAVTITAPAVAITGPTTITGAVNVVGVLSVGGVAVTVP